MPASRRARAITFAPRSWPSRPGLAIKTRIFFSGMGLALALGDRGFLIGAEHGAHGFANLPQRRIGLHRVVDKGHQVVIAFGGFAECVEAARDLARGTFRAQLAEALGLAVRHGLVDLEDLD